MLAATRGLQAADLPAEVLDLSCWSLTLPHASAGEQKPREIRPPALAQFRDATCFFVGPSGEGVVFRANCTSVTTRNSSYPRCELRELAAGNRENTKARWSTTDGLVHRMVVQQAITAVPPVKKHVVCAQIHDAADDVLMIRLEDRKLFVERNRLAEVVLSEDYKLGTRFTIRMEAHHGRIRVWHDDTLKLDWEHARDGCYFKAGCYTQSNEKKGDRAESYGEVVIYGLKVEHLDPGAVRDAKPASALDDDARQAAAGDRR